jgi:glyoxylase-like metal-dependent hydrolase (beta-lactamase superfamily II)
MRKRLLTVLGVVVGVLLVVVGVLWLRVGRIDVERVRNDLYMLSGVGGNVGVLVTPEGVVVVDSMTFVRQGHEILRRIRELTPQPVVTLINTHYHLDHTHGNPAFASGTKVIATPQTRAHLLERDADFWRDPPARDLLPSADEGARSFTVGGRTVRAHHFGRGHTDGDLVVLFVEDRVLHTGDLCFHGHYPNIDLEAGGSVKEWTSTLDRVLALDFDTVIPGHGQVTTRAALQTYREFMATLWEQTSAVVARGGSLEDALAAVDLDRFALRRLWFAPNLSRDFVIGRAFEEASAGRRREH